MSQEFKQQLEESRKRETQNRSARKTSSLSDTANTVKEIGKAMNPAGFFSLIFKIRPFKDWMFGLAILMSLMKDLIDISIIGALPGIGTVITFCISIFVVFMLLMGRFSDGKKATQNSSLKKILVLIFGTISEMLFGINFLPMATTTAIAIYMMVLLEREGGKQKSYV